MNQIAPSRPGQIVRYKYPLPSENPKQLFVVLELKFGNGNGFDRCDIRPLNTGLKFPPTHTVLITDLEISKVSTLDLVGTIVKIKDQNSTIRKGKVLEIKDNEIELFLEKGIEGIDTNVFLKIVDSNKNFYEGHLFITQP